MSGALAKVPAAAVQQEFLSSEQEQMIRDTFLSGASKQEADVLLAIARARRLNPLLRQINFQKRWDSEKQREVWQGMPSIDGFRALAERTGKYRGQLGPFWCGSDGKWVDVWLEEKPPAAAKVGVIREDFREPTWAIARYTSYAQRKKDGTVTSTWAKMPDLMLAKCAEALAIRKAFPEDTSGLYIPEEMQQADERPLRISPHDLGDEADEQAPNLLQDFKQRFDILEKLITSARTFDDILKARSILGSKAKGSDLTRELQRIRMETKELNVEELRELSRTWQRLDRLCAKREKELTPAIEDSFIDEAKEVFPDAQMREPGEEG